MKSLKSKVREARRYDPDLIELRLDYVRGVDLGKIDELDGFLLGNEVLTIRSIAEGGHSAIPDGKRVDLIRYAIASLEPAYFDIEIRTIRKYFRILQKDLNGSKTQVIASYHDLTGRKTVTDLRRIFRLTPRMKSLYAVKIVTRANGLKDNLKALSLYSDFKNRKRASEIMLVSFCTGELGIPSRILCLYLGSPYSYASLHGEAVAPGQLDIKAMRRMLRE